MDSRRRPRESVKKMSHGGASPASPGEWAAVRALRGGAFNGTSERVDGGEVCCRLERQLWVVRRTSAILRKRPQRGLRADETSTLD
jgi:hypothetical protein